MKLKKLICIVMISVLGVLSFAGCAKKQDEKKTETSSEASTQEASAQVFAMDTYMNLKAYGKNAQKAVDDAKSEIERLDQLWSAVDKNSEIYQLNQKKKMKVSDETLELIEFAKKKGQITSRQVETLLGVKQRRARIILGELVNMEILERQGSYKSTIYVLKNNCHSGPSEAF